MCKISNTSLPRYDPGCWWGIKPLYNQTKRKHFQFLKTAWQVLWSEFYCNFSQTIMHWDILKNERILTTTIVYIRLYIYIYIYIIYIYIYLYTYIPISHCIEPMFSEHLSPEAKPRGMCGSMLLEACVRCGAGCREPRLHAWMNTVCS